MSKETLAKLRIFVPGLLIIVFLLPLTQDDLSFSAIVASLKTFEGIVANVFVVGIPGTLYYVLRPRDPFLKRPLRRINDNIKDQLMLPFRGTPEIAMAEARLRQGNTLMDVFYNLVDNDESLKSRAQTVYLNGIFLSSTADLMAVSALAVMIYTIGCLVRYKEHYLLAAFIAGAAYVLGLLMLRIITNRHIELGNRQIGYILVHHKDQLRDTLMKLAK